MSAKSNKIELSEELMVMWKEEQPPEVFCKKSVFRNFAKFTGKHLCLSLFFNKVVGGSARLLKKRLWHRCFPVNFTKFQRSPFFTEHLWSLLLPQVRKVKKILHQE